MTWKEQMALAMRLVGCTVRPPDGGQFVVTGTGIRYGKPAVLGEGVFCAPEEATVLKLESGEEPAFRESDPIMRQVFAVIVGRGEYTQDQIEQWLEHADRHPNYLYEHIASGINEIEDLIGLDLESDPLPEPEPPKGLLERFMWEADGDRVKAGELVGQGLMRGDPAQHKAGYTLPNAMLAVIDLFDMTEGVEALEDDETKQVEANLRGWQEARKEKDAEALLRGDA